MASSIETMDSVAAKLAECTSDLHNLRELERAGWLALEARVRALEEGRARGGIVTDPIPDALGDPGYILNPIQTANLVELSAAIARHPSARRMTPEAVDEAIAAEQQHDFALAAHHEVRRRGHRIVALEAERDRARASAIEWANTPIHRLLAAYDQRRQRETDPQPGDMRGLAIREGERDWWWIDWETCQWAAWNLTDGKISGDWKRGRCSAGTLDAACTNAAEQIEAP